MHVVRVKTSEAPAAAPQQVTLPSTGQREMDKRLPCFDNLFIKDEKPERSLEIIRKVTTILDDLKGGVSAPKNPQAKDSLNNGTTNVFPSQQQRCLISLSPQVLKSLKQKIEELNQLLALKNTDLPNELLRRIHNQTSQTVHPLKFFQDLLENLTNNQINEKTLSLLIQLPINAGNLKKRIEANMPLLVQADLYCILKTAATRFDISEKLQKQLNPQEYKELEIKIKSCTIGLHRLICWFCIVYPEQNLQAELQKITNRNNFREYSSINELVENFIPHSKNFIDKLQEDCATLKIDYQMVSNWAKNNSEKFRFGGSFDPINTIYGIFLTTDTRTDGYLLKEILEKDPSFLFSTHKQGETKTIEDIWFLEKKCQDLINQYEEIKETILEKLDQIRFYQALEKSLETYANNKALEVRVLKMKPEQKADFLNWLKSGLLERDQPQSLATKIVIQNYSWSIIECSVNNGEISLICKQKSSRALDINYATLSSYLRQQLAKTKETYKPLVDELKKIAEELSCNLPQSIFNKKDMLELTCVTEWLKSVKNSQDLWSNLLKVPPLRLKTEQVKSEY